LNQFLEAYAEKPFSEQNNMSNISSAKDEDIHDHMVEKNQIKAIYNAIQNYLDGVTDKIIIRFGEANIAIETKNDLLEYLSAIGMPKEKIESLKELSPMDVKEKNIE
jgi:predicted Zn-dependent protease